MDGKMPVSYTHLDVYKRQQYLLAVKFIESFRPSGPTGNVKPK